MRNVSRIQGFTIPEMIIVVSCLAIVVGLSVGDVTKLLDKQTYEEEKIALQEIEKALEVYAEKEGTLPLDDGICSRGMNVNSTNWSVQLAKYSNLSADMICFDTLGNKRTYISDVESIAFRNGAYMYDVHYSSVLSNGVNRIKDTIDWTDGSGLNPYNLYTPEGDDLLVKFTDKDIKQAKYIQTLDRIEELEKSLERYNRSKRASAQTADVEKFDNYIMYPMDGRSGDNGHYLVSSVNGVDSDMAVGTLENEISAVSLAKILGLPDYLGRNAITNKPMWYISNPGPDRLNPCTDSKDAPPFYPPIILMTTDDKKPTDC